MPASRADRLLAVCAFGVACAILLFGLGRHGIWDPAELSLAEAVRAHDAFAGRPPLYGRLVGAGIRWFGANEWSGRALIALAGVAATALTMALARLSGDARTAAYAGILAVASPLAVLNARWMIGDAPAFLAQAAIGLGAFALSFAPGGATRTRAGSMVAIGILASGIALGIATRGALLTVAPPLLGILVVALVEPRLDTSVARARAVVASVALVLGLVLAYRVRADSGSYELLLGGVAGGTQPPSFERFVQTAFHALAPISPIFVIACARVVRGREDQERGRLELALAAWALASFGAATLFGSRYGLAVMTGVVPVAILAAQLLRDVERGDTPDVTSAVVVTMLFGLLIRDFALYPASPLSAVATPAPTLAPAFQPIRYWAVLFVAGAATFALGASAHTVRALGPLREFPNRVRRLANAGRATRRGRILTIAVALIVFGAEGALVAGAVAGDRLGLSSLGMRACGAGAVALPLAFVALVGVEFALRGFDALGGFRMAPFVLAAACTGAYVQGPFLVDLSGELSPREVYARYNELRTPNDVLVEFGLESNAGAYYAAGERRTIENEQQLVSHLLSPSRTWALFSRGLLTQVNRDYRARTGRHLYIADGRNPEVVLATSQPIEGRRDENPIARAFVRDAAPRFRTAIRFREVELIGYDLDLPGGSTVGAGQAFTVTWYWKVMQAPTTDWRVFLHIDGHGQRLNGDHDPVEGLLPMRQWTVGDIVRDEQRLEVPASYPTGEYKLFIGFFQGETRMPIVSGEHTPDNRGIAGSLFVR